MTDEQLCAAAQTGDERAMETLVRKYTPMANNICATYFMPRQAKEDLLQEAMMGLVKAVRDYKHRPDGHFHGFADMCIRRKVISAVKTSTRLKHSALNSAASMEAPIYANDGPDTTRTIGDSIPDEAPLVEDISVAAELTVVVREAIVDSGLSELEASMLRLYMMGHSYKQIAAAVSRTEKAVDNGLTRAFRKCDTTIREAVGDYYAGETLKRREVPYVARKNNQHPNQVRGLNISNHRRYCMDAGKDCPHDAEIIAAYNAKYAR
jgi:RNA polymerase sporulation-specific sigma factor